MLECLLSVCLSFYVLPPHPHPASRSLPISSKQDFSPLTILCNRDVKTPNVSLFFSDNAPGTYTLPTSSKCLNLLSCPLLFLLKVIKLFPPCGPGFWALPLTPASYCPQTGQAQVTEWLPSPVTTCHTLYPSPFLTRYSTTRDWLPSGWHLTFS